MPVCNLTKTFQATMYGLPAVNEVPAKMCATERNQVIDALMLELQNFLLKFFIRGIKNLMVIVPEPPEFFIPPGNIVIHLSELCSFYFLKLKTTTLFLGTLMTAFAGLL